MPTTYKVMLRFADDEYLELDRYTREKDGDDYRGEALSHAREASRAGRTVEVWVNDSHDRTYCNGMVVPS